MELGAKIKALRIQNGLTQEELADRAELTKGFISQVERDITSLSIATLVDVLECLGSNLKDFFSEYEEEKIVFGEKDFFVTQDEEKGNEITWIVPNSQKNDMEPILLTLEPGGKSECDDPHVGEEFGYLISGSIILHLGNKKLKIKKGECFYFQAGLEHYLENNGKTQAKVLWVSSPPMF